MAGCTQYALDTVVTQIDVGKHAASLPFSLQDGGLLFWSGPEAGAFVHSEEVNNKKLIHS